MGKKEETIRNISGNILKTLFRHQKALEQEYLNL